MYTVVDGSPFDIHTNPAV